MIEHPIDNDPRHRDVEPDREGPASDPNVSVEAPSQCAIHRDQGQRDDRRGQDGVGDQDREVKDSNRSPPRESDRSHVIVICQVGDQKDGGGP